MILALILASQSPKESSGEAHRIFSEDLTELTPLLRGERLQGRCVDQPFSRAQGVPGSTNGHGSLARACWEATNHVLTLILKPFGRRLDPFGG